MDIKITKKYFLVKLCMDLLFKMWLGNFQVALIMDCILNLIVFIFKSLNQPHLEINLIFKAIHYLTYFNLQFSILILILHLKFHYRKNLLYLLYKISVLKGRLMDFKLEIKLLKLYFEVKVHLSTCLKQLRLTFQPLHFHFKLVLSIETTIKEA